MFQTISQTRVVIWWLLKTVFRKRLLLFVEPHHPNLGDLAQLMCTRKMLYNNFPDYTIIEAGQFFAPFDNGIKTHFINFSVLKLIALKLLVHKDDILIGHSGYFFVDHHSGWFAYELILKFIPNNRFIILPQTVNFYDPFVLNRVKKAFSNHPNLTLMCRDKVSYQNATNLFNGIKLLLFPDIVTSLIGSKHYNNKRDGVLFCLRDDVEAFYKEKDINRLKSHFEGIRIEQVDTTLKMSLKDIERNSEKEILKMIEKMSTFQLVITDRYHGTIFSAIASTPVIVINSADHKLSSGVNWFPSQIFGNMVQYAETLEKALNMADDILSQVQENYYNPPYFKENYWDKVVDYLS